MSQERSFAVERVSDNRARYLTLLMALCHERPHLKQCMPATKASIHEKSDYVTQEENQVNWRPVRFSVQLSRGV